MPADLMRAVSHAHIVLSWQENLSEDDMPPEWMWALDEELEDWFDEVKAARKERYGGGAGDDDEAPMMQNKLAKAKKRR